MRVGVYQPGKDTDGWTWYCVCGAGADELISNRESARDEYKNHRLRLCPQNASVVEKTPIKPKEEEEMAATKKTVKKKGTTKGKGKAVKKTVKKKTIPKKDGKKLWRIGFVKNKTGREVNPNVKKDGGVFPYMQESLGAKKVDRWVEVRAVTRAEALVAAKKGKGEWFGKDNK